MTPPRIGSLVSQPWQQDPDLLAAPVARGLAGWSAADRVGVVAIDPEVADTAAMRRGGPPAGPARTPART